MKYIKEEKCYLFEDDDEFMEFAVNPSVKISVTPKGTPYYDWDFSNQYKKALEDGDSFKINDENSKVKKRGCATWKLISKKVKNLAD